VVAAALLATTDALHTQRETARHLVEDEHTHYIMILKGNQGSTLNAAIAILTGTDTEFAATTHLSEDRRPRAPGTPHGAYCCGGRHRLAVCGAGVSDPA
jgi:hypothetical protein